MLCLVNLFTQKPKKEVEQLKKAAKVQVGVVSL